MERKYKKNFLNKVIARIDFTSPIEIPPEGFSQNLSNAILSSFPLPEIQTEIQKQIVFTKDNTSERMVEKKLYFFNDMSKEKKICITTEFAWIQLSKYESFDKLKNDFFILLYSLANERAVSVNRFGLRYINIIELPGNYPFSWATYINSSLISSINFIEDKSNISRIFSNIVQQYEDNMILNFQYGLFNSDFPARIKQRKFTLDFDAYYQGVFDPENLKECINKSHERIKIQFENSIKQKLRNLMGE